MNNSVTLCNIQHTSGNQSLKGPTLESADKYTTLLPLTWPIKPVFSLAPFFVQSNFLLNPHWLATFFEVKKVGSNPTFYCFWMKKAASLEKIRKWKTSFKIKYVNKNFVISSKYPPHPAFNFEAMKWCWTNFQIQVAWNKKNYL